MIQQTESRSRSKSKFNPGTKSVHQILSRPDRSAPQSQNCRVAQVFLNVDFRNQHEGLAAVARKAGLDPAKLQPGQFVVFLNSKKDRIKLYGAHNVVAYHKSETRIDMTVLPRIIQAFNRHGTIDYDSVLRQRLTEVLARKPRRSASN